MPPRREFPPKNKIRTPSEMNGNWGSDFCLTCRELRKEQILHKNAGAMRAPTGMAQLIAQTENNQTKELPLRGSWHGAAVTEGVR